MEKDDVQFIDKKLEVILKYRDELEGVFAFSDPEIKKDNLKLHTIERLIQLIADEMVDVNGYLIRKFKFPVPDNFQSTFYVLADNNILDNGFAQKLAPIVGLRNRLVHRYEEVNFDLLIRVAKDGRSDFKDYVKYISEFITKN